MPARWSYARWGLTLLGRTLGEIQQEVFLSYIDDRCTCLLRDKGRVYVIESFRWKEDTAFVVYVENYTQFV